MAAILIMHSANQCSVSFLMVVFCVFPYGAVGWFAVCDCVICSLYSLTFWEQMLLKELQDKCHCSLLGYPKGIILAILNLHLPQCHIASLSSIRRSLGGDSVKKNLKMAALTTILDIRKE